ncbi:ribosomal protein S18 acetylase RimI-like enzyme [Streptomyces sp. Amel2xB2]|uniref:GNAT family N-acetyltransferase n=1 Tax=Streptomyces sp. Amel2xB2 TaxID=1305829 RepID=UPI000DBAC67F|nr:N-acetyltransferase [Streptomyces sp. Amel2xB2]RAJ71439.1 ribosomal protein S18 acetylase RimI-like enzyme [Streptomyces sp. Amel2xB2]
MDVTIRPARDDELDEVGELTARAYLEDGLLTFGEEDPYLERLRAARLRAQHTELLVAVDAASDAVLGAVAFVGEGGAFGEVAAEGEGEFRMLAVRPEGRGRGAGEALVRACVERARERGLRRLVLSSTGEMATAHRLYGRLGFVRAPERDWYPYQDLALHVFVLDL